MPDLWLPAGPDPLTTHRVESWRVDLLTGDDAPVGVLSGVAGCWLEQNASALIHGGGSMDLTDVGQDVDWLTMRAQPWWTVAGYGSWPLGVYLLASPVEQVRAWGRTWHVELLDKLTVLDQDKIATSFSLPAGTVVTDAVRQVILDAGETAVAITGSPETLPAGMVWEAGTSRLRIVNDLLGTINYWALRCDRYGRYTAAPYVPPAERAPVRAFMPGPDAIHVPEVTRDQDLIAVPNRVVVIARSGLDEPALVGVAENTDPESRFSYQGRNNRWITVAEQGIEATSQDVVDAIAARRLVELSAVAATDEIQHAMVPLDPHDVVTLEAARATVQGWAVDLAIGTLMRTTVREVAT